MPKKEATPPRPWTDDLESDLRRILTVGEECISEKELQTLITVKGRGTEKYAEHDTDRATDVAPRIRLYDGFEPSGRMHIAQGLLKSVNVNKCTSPGTHSTFCFWVADWFALMNDKMGGDLQKIVIVGKYLIEVWKAAGMDLTNVEFRWASEEITEKAHIYWPLMLDVARRFNATRIKKCCQIMGRLEGNLTAAQVLYPLMQCTDVFFLQADICQLGVDQRKVNMLAREYCDAAKKRYKPVILSHHMLYGLKEGQEKMSKSDPDSAIFMEDTVEDVERKIHKAYCPTQEKSKEGEESTATDAGKESMNLTTDNLKNPILDYVQHIVLSPPGATFTCATAASPDGQTFEDYNTVKEDFLKGDITPDQLKRGLIESLNKLLQPVRDHFENDETAKGLFEQIKEFKKQTAAPVAAAASNDVPKVPRLDLVEKGVIPASSHLVLAPLPNSNPTLQSAADILAKLKAVEGDDTPKVLMLLDWTARVNSALDADAKLITAYYSVLLASLRALDTYLHGDDGGIMKNVTVVTQSEAILKDPSSYWISVINAGRHFSLNEVMGMGIGLGEGMKDSESVGKVIGRLMMIADVLAVNPKSIALDAYAGDDVTNGMEKMNLEGEDDDDSKPQSVEAHLIQHFYSTKLSHPGLASILPVPQLTHISAASGPNLALQLPRESAAHKTEFDEYFLTDDPKVHGKSKMKKAFCEPGNVDFCPPIDLLAYFGGLDGGKKEGVTISRSPENGGNVTYTTKSAILGDFESGALHPGDLKAVVSAVMVEVLTKMNGEIKGDGAAAKGVKALKAFEKKMAKQKKK
mmetsp:Transcript_20119/g.43679  ORF Transcript_20119/g.43679 Transcript_20119/m.43679 type:complete len:805 (-) Transcript_20119:70-2484(-)|eukprot:CAMPEP_0172326050 /NCGR_PEP_ID=MMETSP1058-20130122/55424_1 /TAXON_ID=83371 /ORGANISM="Detonula confervacea, Strain CCMP 353" /LENGTH=804 /DNA_ID=CAMNT_0013042741 /DNA_START=123 /DNA_END=2537 /DNA_ORIENTATION=-